MKTFAAALAVVAVALCGIAHANSVTIKSSSQSVSPLKVTYQVAQMNQGNSASFGKPHTVTLNPSESLRIKTPLEGYDQSGVLISRLTFTTTDGQVMTKTFKKNNFGQYESCSLATTKKHANGDLNLFLGKHRLACQHANA